MPISSNAASHCHSMRQCVPPWFCVWGVIIVSLFLGMGVSVEVQAHPHIFIDVSVDFEVIEGAFERARIVWEMDPMSSELIVDGTPGESFSETEACEVFSDYYLQELERNNMMQLRFNERILPLTVENLAAELGADQASVIYRFDLRFAPIRNVGQQVMLEFYDVAYFTAFFTAPERVSMTGKLEQPVALSVSRDGRIEMTPRLPTTEAPVVAKTEPTDDPAQESPELDLVLVTGTERSQGIFAQLRDWLREAKSFFDKQRKIYLETPSWGTMAMVMSAAFLFGFVDALGPGHGKLITTAFFSTQSAARWQVLAFGLVNAGMHVLTATILALWFGESLRNVLVVGATGVMGTLKVYGMVLTGIVVIVLLLLMARRWMHRQTEKGKNHWLMVALVSGVIPCPATLTIVFLFVLTGTLQLALMAAFSVFLGIASVQVLVGVLAMFGNRGVCRVIGYRQETKNQTALDSKRMDL